MTVRQLSREQLNELKETYMFETVCSGPSYSDLAEACNIPSAPLGCKLGGWHVSELNKLFRNLKKQDVSVLLYI